MFRVFGSGLRGCLLFVFVVCLGWGCTGFPHAMSSIYAQFILPGATMNNKTPLVDERGFVGRPTAKLLEPANK